MTTSPVTNFPSPDKNTELLFTGIDRVSHPIPQAKDVIDIFEKLHKSFNLSVLEIER